MIRKEVIHLMQLRQTIPKLSDEEFIRLTEAKSDSFYRVAYGYVRNTEDAKDIVQEAICKAYVHRSRLKDADKFYPWFYRILTNTAASFLRKHARTVPWDQEVLDLPVSQEDRWGDALLVREVLSGLEAKSRTVIILKIYENMTFSEIAQIVKKPENTVKTLYYRGLKSLKERMQINGYEPEWLRSHS